MEPLKVSEGMPTRNIDEREQCGGSALKYDTHNLSTSIMFSKPILALEFSEMKMQVEAPKVIFQTPSNCFEPSVTVSTVVP